jgi:hypothetical protein
MDQVQPFLFEHWERFECSLSPVVLRGLLPSTPTTASRDGLGVWEGVALDFDGHKAYALAPQDRPQDGASIWCAPGLEPPRLAGAIRAKAGVRALFMMPDGRPLPAVPA